MKARQEHNEKYKTKVFLYYGKFPEYKNNDVFNKTQGRCFKQV